MKKGIYAGIGIAIIIVIGAYGAISQSEIDPSNETDENLGLSDSVTPVLEVGEPNEPEDPGEPEGESLQVNISDGVAAKELP